MPGIKEVCRLVRFHAQIHARVGLFFRSFSTAFGVVSRKMNVPALVSTLWLNEQMMAPDFLQSFRVLDATWDLPMFKRDFKKEHETERIPGARYFSLSECSDPSSTLPHMLPTAEDFAKYVSNLGVENKHHVILYDNSVRFGIFSAPRVWWTFKVFGQEKVSVLDGGLPKWVKDGLKTTSGPYGKDDKLPGKK